MSPVNIQALAQRTRDPLVRDALVTMQQQIVKQDAMLRQCHNGLKAAEKFAHTHGYSGGEKLIALIKDLDEALK